ncbi:MAG: hypothetical protein ABSG46_17995 [Candidatus Binataceae bacterium]|jgi:hypothetical protein
MLEISLPLPLHSPAAFKIVSQSVRVNSERPAYIFKRERAITVHAINPGVNFAKFQDPAMVPCGLGFVENTQRIDQDRRHQAAFPLEMPVVLQIRMRIIRAIC